MASSSTGVIQPDTLEPDTKEEEPNIGTDVRGWSKTFTGEWDEQDISAMVQTAYFNMLMRSKVSKTQLFYSSS